MSEPVRDYVREFGLAMLAYIIVLPVVGLVIQAHPTAGWRLPLAGVPLVPAALALLAVIRSLGGMNEMQRRIQLEALVFGFGATAILTFSYGFLQNTGLPALSWTWILPLMAVLWLLGLFLASRRSAT